MTAIDRAFIKAYRQDGPSPQAVPTEATAGSCACTDCVTSLSTTEPEAEHDKTAIAATGEGRPSGLLSGRGESPLAAGSDRRDACPTGSGDHPGCPSPREFQPAFQVDNFAWPSGCARLRMVAAEPLEQLAAALEAGLEQGRQVVALSGCRRGDGCTTLLLAVARRLAERGLKVAMVDADFANPLLARRLGLLPEAGWEEVLVGGLPVQEALIESLQEGLAVLPWCGSLQGQALPAAESPKLASRLDVLREYYDLVLVDLGRFASGQEDDDRDGGDAAGLLTAWVDAVVLVHDVRSTPPAELERVRQRVAAAGLVEAGIAENFVEFRGSA